MGVQGTSFSIFVQWSELDQMIVVDFSLIGIGFWMELKGPNSSFLLNGAFSSNLQNPRTFVFFFLMLHCKCFRSNRSHFMKLLVMQEFCLLYCLMYASFMITVLFFRIN